MKKLTFIVLLAAVLAGSALGAIAAPAYAQIYEYPPQPPDPFAYPWVGPNTPWVYYNGDWFLNGILYYFFGPIYGWAPYYAYPPVYIVRPMDWYAPRWVVWYERHPQYYENFIRVYPYWRDHTHTRHYDRDFYERHHPGQGTGWHEGWRGVKPEQRRAPEHAVPPVERKLPPTTVTPPAERRVSPGGAVPPVERKTGPELMAPQKESKPAPARVVPPEGHPPAPTGHAAPAPKPEKAAPAPKPEKGGEHKPEKGGPGEGK